jgi:type II secretory ATPase GspE/PulE/Tfp pilus assembly ATPase PilB-like protein
MVSSSSDRTEARGKDTTSSGIFKIDQASQVDTEQAFRLIDSILPFEACLYHQILPLSLEGSRLRLGVVNAEDTAALDYVRRILAYMNCSLVPQALASDVHHVVLTSYLNYAGQRDQAAKPSDTIAQSNTRIQADPVQHSTMLQVDESPASSNRAKLEQNLAATFLVDSPTVLTEIDRIQSRPAAPSANPNLTQPKTLLLEPDLTPPEPAAATVPAVSNALPVLLIQPQHLADPVTVLATLPPDRLVEELLGRILVGGIGRLYFERQQHCGRILWSQNGVLQSVLEELPLEILQGVINELKRMNRLPMIPVKEPRQVEIERLYQKHRLLLRLRVMPGSYGEEATLQVLRGAALKFYRQQQLTTISRDALVIAQELQRRVQELRLRSRHAPMTPDQLTILPALGEVLKSVEQQLESLRMLQAEVSFNEADD